MSIVKKLMGHYAFAKFMPKQKSAILIKNRQFFSNKKVINRLNH